MEQTIEETYDRDGSWNPYSLGTEAYFKLAYNSRFLEEENSSAASTLESAVKKNTE